MKAKAGAPDVAFALVQNGLMNAKSIGLPVKVHQSKSLKCEQNPELARVDLILDEWILLEYSCCYLGVQQNATVEAVSKSLSPAIVAEDVGVVGAHHPFGHIARAGGINEIQGGVGGDQGVQPGRLLADMPAGFIHVDAGRGRQGFEQGL
ncbi:MAG TPA: hypothetical protein VKS79_01365 [Gemmataceae bacterium]|nr:hypothetical protein [Gemmataceae bacterium]